MANPQKWIRTIDRRNMDNVMRLAYEMAAKLLEGNEAIKIEVREITRSEAQNDKLHAMITDVSRQAVWTGEKMDVYGWKSLFVSGHTVATNAPHKFVIGIEGEIVNIRESTANMGVRRCASLITYIDAWSANNGITFMHTREM